MILHGTNSSLRAFEKNNWFLILNTLILRAMKIQLHLVFMFMIGLLLASCRSDFELIRTSGDAEAILEAADQYFDAEDYTKANTLYELVIPAYRGKAEAERIAYNFATGHYLNRSYTLSSHYFKAFADTYNASSRKEEALYLSALSYYKLSPRHKLDQSDSQEAIDAFQLFINAYPESDKIADCNKSIDELRLKMELKAFEAGKLYYHTSNYSSSIQSLENLLKDFPDSPHDEEARYLIVKASIDWANRSIFTKKEERFKKTVERCNAYLKKHDGGERAEEIATLKSECENELKQIQNG